MVFDQIKTKAAKLLPIKNSEDRALIKGTGSSLVVRTIGAALAFGLHILLARLLGVTEYGAYIFIYSWITVFIVPLRLGFDNGLLRFIPQYKHIQAWSSLKGFVYFSYKSVSTISVLGAVLVIGIIIYFDGILVDYNRRLIIIGALAIPLFNIAHLNKSSLMGFKKVARALAPELILKHTIGGIGVLGIYWFYQEVSAEEAMIVTLVAVGWAVVVGGIFLKKEWNRFPPLQNQQPAKKYRYWLSITFPMLLITGLQIILANTDLIVIGIIMGKKAVGVYGAVFKISLICLFGLQAIEAIAVPLFSELFHGKKEGQLQNIVNIATRGSFMLALVMFILFILFGKYILGFFGTYFVTGYFALLILSFGLLVQAFSGSVVYLMAMTGYQNIVVKILGVSATINIGLNIIFIPLWGIKGGALATAVATILWNVVLVYYVHKKLNINSMAI